MVGKDTIIGIGNIYLETDFLGVNSGEQDSLEPNKSYSSTSYETYVGGSTTNFIKQLKKLGRNVGLIARIGKDETGKEVKRLLEADGITVEYLVESEEVQTSIVVGIVLSHNGEHIPVIGGDANQNLRFSDIDFGLSLFNEASAVYLSGYFKQEKLWRDYPTLFSQLKDKGIKVFVDPQRLYPDTQDEQLEVFRASLRYVEGLFLNEQEIKGITKEDDQREALEKLSADGPKFIALKLGERGCVVCSDGNYYESEGISVSVVSTVGAGDSFNAGFITQYLLGKSLEGCAHFANATAALKVSQIKMPTREDVLKFMSKLT